MRYIFALILTLAVCGCSKQPDYPRHVLIITGNGNVGIASQGAMPPAKLHVTREDK